MIMIIMSIVLICVKTIDHGECGNVASDGDDHDHEDNNEIHDNS